MKNSTHLTKGILIKSNRKVTVQFMFRCRHVLNDKESDMVSKGGKGGGGESVYHYKYLQVRASGRGGEWKGG